jgi:chemotaxis protein MotA
MMPTTVLGVFGAAGLFAFIGMQGGLRVFWNPTGAVIMLGGIAVAALLAFRAREIAAAFTALGGIFRADHSVAPDVADLVDFCRLVHGHAVRDAEARLGTVASPFLKLGLQLVLDGMPVNDILHVMNWRIQKLVEREQAQVRFFRTLAGLAPAFGLVATLVGLIGLMAELGTSTIGSIGEHMSVALVATFYGVVLANMVFKPIGVKLEQRTAQRVRDINVLLEGIVLVRLGRSPGFVSEAMEQFLHEAEDELHGRD